MYIYCFVLFGVIGDGLFFLISTTTPVLKGCDHFFCLRWKKIRRTRYKYVNTVLKRDIVVSGGNTLNQIHAAEFDKFDREDNIRKKNNQNLSKREPGKVF